MIVERKCHGDGYGCVTIAFLHRMGRVSMSLNDRIVLISGTAHPQLAQSISRELDLPLADAHLDPYEPGPAGGENAPLP